MISSELSAEQTAAIEAQGGVVVEAGPGTGKTHLIAAKVARLIADGCDPKRILLLTFSRRAVAELRERIVHLGQNACEIRTFHGFASRLLEASGPRFRTRRLLGPFTEALVFERAIASTELTTIDAVTQRSRRFAADVARFAADIRRAESSSVAALTACATPRITDLLRIADRAATLRETLRASNLDDLIARAVEALSDPASAQSRWLEDRYTHLLVDEFQDVDRQQLALCERIGATIFAVGDPAQTIYRFRGAASGMFEEGATRLGLQRFVLGTSRRCPHLICDLAAATPLLGANALTSAVTQPGSIEARAARTTLDEAAMIADRIEDDVTAGVPLEQIAVLLRSMKPLGPSVVAELRARRIAVAASGSDAFFADPNVRVIRLVLRALAKPSETSRWIALLTSPRFACDHVVLGCRLVDTGFATVAEAAEWIASSAPVSPAVRSRLAATLLESNACFERDEIGRAARSVISGLGLIEDETHEHDMVRARIAIERMMRLADGLGEAQQALLALGERGSSAAIVETIDDHIEELGANEVPADDVRGVRVLTIHASKGLQFETVVIGDAVDGRFPSNVVGSALLDDEDRDRLTACDVASGSISEVDKRLEEASLWYVAVTRSRNALFITYATQGADGEPQRPSRFLPAGLHPADYVAPFERSGERFELALLASEDPRAASLIDELAATSPLVAALKADGLAAFGACEQRPVTVAGTLAVTAAELWLHCPRRFYYQHVLELQGRGGTAMTYGSALHAVLERFHTDYMSFGAGSASLLETFVQRLQQIRRAVWQELDFGASAIVDATAVTADRVLERYAASLVAEAAESPFEVCGLEVRVEVPLPSGRLRGRIDRLDRRADGTIVIRDYKASRLKKTKLSNKVNGIVEAEFVAGDVPSDFKAQILLYRTATTASLGAPGTEFDYVFLKGSDDAPAIVHDVVRADEAVMPTLEFLESYVDEHFVKAFADGVADRVRMTSNTATCRFCEQKRRRICAGVAE